jgi:hypothetical protein
VVNLAGLRRRRELAPVVELPRRRYLASRRFLIGRQMAADVCALLGVDLTRVATLTITAEGGGLWVTVEEVPQR